MMLYLLIALVLLTCFGVGLLLFDSGDLRADDPSRFYVSDFPPPPARSHYLPMGSGIHGDMDHHISFAIDGLHLREVL